ncbi:hypothetical protein [Hyphomicrobium sp. 2TAF46]|uniref:hypothetical protein n=1 Tax=Hyphomicrobium sp. 2TAF46 TaxID=3233019 RepID=UPI003F926B9F
MIPPIAASFQPQSIASRPGDGFNHIQRDRLVAGAVERRLGSFGIGFGLVPNRFEPGHTLFEG